MMRASLPGEAPRRLLPVGLSNFGSGAAKKRARMCGRLFRAGVFDHVALPFRECEFDPLAAAAGASQGLEQLVEARMLTPQTVEARRLEEHDFNVLGGRVFPDSCDCDRLWHGLSASD